MKINVVETLQIELAETRKRANNLETAIRMLEEGGGVTNGNKPRFSAARRAKLRKAAKLRWAKVKAKKNNKKRAPKPAADSK